MQSGEVIHLKDKMPYWLMWTLTYLCWHYGQKISFSKIKLPSIVYSYVIYLLWSINCTSEFCVIKKSLQDKFYTLYILKCHDMLVNYYCNTLKSTFTTDNFFLIIRQNILCWLPIDYTCTKVFLVTLHSNIGKSAENDW